MSCILTLNKFNKMFFNSPNQSTNLSKNFLNFKCFFKIWKGASLVVQWLRLCASNAGA